MLSAAWAKQEQISVPLLSDLNKKEVTKAYEVVLPSLAGIGTTSTRAAFVIDKQGVIRYSEQTASLNDLPNFVQVTGSFKKLGLRLFLHLGKIALRSFCLKKGFLSINCNGF